MNLIKNKIIILSTILLSLVQFAYAAKPAQPIENDTTIQNAVLFYINEYRQQHGLSKLQMDNHIVAQAKKHSMEMANHSVPFGHKGFSQRIVTLRSQIKNAGAGGENVAFNYKTARQVVSNWVLSPGHKRNIVGHYNLTGIGVARDKQGRIYYTQIFILKSKQQAKPSHYARRKPFFIFG